MTEIDPHGRDKNRRSGHCQQCRLPFPERGPDPCLGMLPGVQYACCGHGEEAGYILFANEKVVRFAPMHAVGTRPNGGGSTEYLFDTCTPNPRPSRQHVSLPKDTFIEVVQAVADLDDSSQRESYYGWSDLLARLRTLAKQRGILERELFPPEKYRKD